MRSLNFRDNVLWPIAYKLGLDPEVSLLKNQAYALASYINAYVRRLWDSTDWPEWTLIDGLAVTNHIIPYQKDVITNGHYSIRIGRILKVYLMDPRTTWLPVDIPFRPFAGGIHVGFEHSQNVWIKYLPYAPQFTAKEWSANVTYNLDDLTYSPATGECYRSKTSNNLGHDPSQPGGGAGPLLPPMVEETVGAPDNPGLPATSKITAVTAATVLGPVPDPPLASSIGEIEVRAADGVTVLGTATHTATGAESLLTIFTDLKAQLTAALTGFTVNLVTTPLKITLEHASDFKLNKATIKTATDVTYPLKLAQAQAYVPATPAVAGTGQQLKLTITEEQVVPGALYILTFTSVDSHQHQAAYTALPTDNAAQILSGLIDNVITLQSTDDFFTGVHSTLDTVSPSTTFTIDQATGMVSLHSEIETPGSSYWDLVPFPFALVDQVVRGAYADALKDGGQTDKGSAEEQLVPTEQQVRTATQLGPEYLPLTDQQKPKSRYAVK